MTIPHGTRLSRYEIRQLLGAGGMGEVYLAHDLTLQRKVVLKVLRTDLTAREDQLQRFEREAFAASTLNHPNILTIYEIVRDNGYHFIVTEFVDGESLGQRIQRKPLKLHEILDIGVQIASALAAAHEAGIMHRDIKPDNIMLRRDRLVKVLDFGLAKLGEQEGIDLKTQSLTKALQLTEPGIVIGTPHYMSPEQARALPVDGRTDIWSLGVVLYLMVSGHLPFTGQTLSDVIAAILTKEPTPLTTYMPEVPAELERIITRALRKEKTERYQSVKEMGRDLKLLKQELEFEAELERTGKADKTREPGRTATSAEAPATETKQDAAARNTGGASARHARTPSSARYMVGEFKQHKLGALALVAVIVALSTALAYLAYTHYVKGSKEAITSLAVLPFVNASNDAEKEYLSDGISESLISRLSQLPGVKVIANSSSSKYKGKDIDPQQVAHALGVTSILTGRVTQLADNLSISVELIDARDGTQVWGEQYNRKATDLLQVQAEISSEIAGKLRLRLTAGQQQQVNGHETVNPQAYELLLKGRFYRSKGGTLDRKQAAEYFQQAIAVDPNYALAYAELSNAYRTLVGSSNLDPKEYLPKAEEAAAKAIELDENLADAHYVQANLKTYAWAWADAEKEYKRAIELNPNLALAHRWYAGYLRLVGRHEQAIEEINRARELDPLSLPVSATVGYILFSARQYDQAIEALKKTLGMDQDYPYTHLFLGFTYAAKGMLPEAINAYQEAIRLGLDSPSTQIYLGAAYARSGDRERAQTILTRLQTSQQYVSPGQWAILYVAQGEREQAFAALERAYEEHDLQLQYLGVEPEFDPLRSDPRFQDLLRRVGLAP
jgi:serine/threonine protein kinase/Tfp pilus assembly protein PilF